MVSRLRLAVQRLHNGQHTGLSTEPEDVAITANKRVGKARVDPDIAVLSGEARYVVIATAFLDLKRAEGLRRELDDRWIGCQYEIG